MTMRFAQARIALAASTIFVSLATAQEPRPDAAKVYRMAFAELAQALGDADRVGPDYPYVSEPSEAAYLVAPWAELLEKTATARDLFAQAARMQSCTFDDRSGPLHEELLDRAGDHEAMREFLRADAYRNLAERPEASLEVAGVLLAYACHLDQQPGLMPKLLAASTAEGAISLCNAVLERHPGDALNRQTIARMLLALERRTERRATLKDFADGVLRDARSLLDRTIETSGTRREDLREVRQASLEILQRLVAPMRRSQPEDLESLRRADREAIAALRSKLGRRAPSKLIATAEGETLATAMALTAAPDTAGLIEAWRSCRDRQAAACSKLRARLLRADPVQSKK